jgi:adenylate cyclase, class 2
MKFEVEQKFPVQDMAELERRLSRLGATAAEPELQVDTYYAHPCRDFARTDEALRLRRIGWMNYVTYKGPKIDTTTKTRQELELPLAAGQAGAAGFESLLQALGFARVAEVRKQRRRAVVVWQEREVEVLLDDVAGLGTFVELELQADEPEVEPSKVCLASLAEKLGLAAGERRSYLELLLLGKNV